MGSSGLGGKSLGLDSGSEVNACCMLCPGLLDFLMGCCMKSSLSHGYGRHRACCTLGFGHAQHLHTLRNTRARTQLHRHRTTVLAIVSAQRSCS